MTGNAFRYDSAGVDTDKARSGLGRLALSIDATLRLRDGHGFGRPAMGLGYYANVLELPGGQGLAISTDGVGTKVIIAQLAQRYDSIGIDLIAMNVNDILCVGAEPFSMVDYVAVGEISGEVFEALGKGLLAGAIASDITIPGGEIAQVRELVRGHGSASGLDLVGTAVGLVPWEKVNTGQDVKPGDAVIGLEADGLHSNGYTLARNVLLTQAGLRLDQHIHELSRTLADELLRPTRIYVKPVVELLRAGVPLHALLHITGDGFCNINRITSNVGFVLDRLPEPGAIYALIQSLGSLSDAEMFSVFNMGVGFCVVTPPAEAAGVIEAFRKHGIPGQVIGYATSEHVKQVRLPKYGLVGGRERLRREGA